MTLVDHEGPEGLEALEAALRQSRDVVGLQVELLRVVRDGRQGDGGQVVRDAEDGDAAPSLDALARGGAASRCACAEQRDADTRDHD